MTVLQKEIMQSLDGMSEDKLQVVYDMIRSLMKLNVSESKDIDNTPRIGVAKGQKFIADGYDFDEANDEIADMFGVNA